MADEIPSWAQESEVPAWAQETDTKKSGYGLSDALGASPETALHLVSGAIAAPVAGLSGLMEGAINTGSKLLTGRQAGPDAADIVRKVQSAMTYEPRTQGGQNLTQAIEYIPQKLGEGANWAGEKTADATGSPALGAAINTAIQAAPAVLLHKALPIYRSVIEGPTASPAVQSAGSLGIRLTPEEAQSGFAGRAIQSLSGAAKLERTNARLNAADVDKAALDQVGMADTSPAAIAKAKAPHNAVYNAIGKTGKVNMDKTYVSDVDAVQHPQAEGALPINRGIAKEQATYRNVTADDAQTLVNHIRQLRVDARSNLKALNQPDQNALGRAQLNIANALEDQLDRHLQSSSFQMPDGSPLTIEQFRNARQGLAQIHSIEDALDGTHVSPKELHKQLERGVPLSGNLKTIAEAYGNFPRSLQDVSAIRNSGPFSVLDSAIGGVGATAAHVAGLPIATVSGPAVAAMLARPLTRASLASRLYQRYGIQGQPIARLPARALIPAELSAQDDPQLTQLANQYGIP